MYRCIVSRIATIETRCGVAGENRVRTGQKDRCGGASKEVSRAATLDQHLLGEVDQVPFIEFRSDFVSAEFLDQWAHAVRPV